MEKNSRVIYGNTILAGYPQYEKMDYPKPHLVMKDNPRPRCAFIIGDGFTQGYLRHYNLHREIPCTVNDLIPSPKEISYIPTKQDAFNDSIFFTKEKWPKIFSYFSDGLEGVEFFKKISKERINPKIKDGLWSLSNNTIGYELRCYLWHYFRSCHNKLLYLRNSRPIARDYKWYNILRTVLEKFFLQIVSFNYDALAQVVIHDIRLMYSPSQVNVKLYGIFQNPVEMSYNYYMNYSNINAIPISYIHGSWTNLITFPWPISLNNKEKIVRGNSLSIGEKYTMLTGFDANPWLDEQFLFTDNFFSFVASHQVENPIMFPMFPDIIPPGFQGVDKYNPYSAVNETSRRILHDADIVIICGLSGNEPDTEEVVDLLGSIKSDTAVVQVGLDHDRENPVATTLKNLKKVEWLFFDALKDLTNVEEYLNDRF